MEYITCYLKSLLGLSLLAFGGTDAAPILHQGSSTYYHANAAASCSLGESIDYAMTTALGVVDYDNASMCGAYLRVIGPKGEVVVRVVDTCGSCKPGELDLNQDAFEKVADVKKGREPMQWHILSPALNTNTQYHFKAGSNAWWAAVQIRNHRNPVAKLEYLKPDGTWSMIERAKYNYFVQKKPGMGLGPFTFRVTDMFGHSFVDKNIEFMAGGTVEGKNQFPFESPPDVAADVQYGTRVGRTNASEIRQPASRRIQPVEVRLVSIPQPIPTVESVAPAGDPPDSQPQDAVNLDQLVDSRNSNTPRVSEGSQDEAASQEPPQDAQNLDQLVNSRSSRERQNE